MTEVAGQRLASPTIAAGMWRRDGKSMSPDHEIVICIPPYIGAFSIHRPRHSAAPLFGDTTMAKLDSATADWRTIDAESLPTDIRSAYDAYKSANRLAQAAREFFEQQFTHAVPVPAGSRLAFGYRFGKLSIAVIPDDRPATKPSSKPLTMADLLAMQRTGR